MKNLTLDRAPKESTRANQKLVETLRHDMASVASALSTIDYLLGVTPPDVVAAKRLTSLSLERLTQLIKVSEVISDTESR